MALDRSTVAIKHDNKYCSVMEFEHNSLVVRLQEKLGLDHSDASNLFSDLKQFLYLCGTVPGHWGPSQAIDDAWHEFIVFTADYANFCQKFFGRFIHHTPNDPQQTVDRSRPRRTLAAAIALFGKQNLSKNWSYPSKYGVPALSPELDSDIETLSPCDGCGCSAACTD